MFTREDPMSLTNLGDGAAIEQFDEELQKVLDNIVDPNTEAKQVRKIILTVSIKPDDDRSIGEICIECDSRKGPQLKFFTKCLIGRTGKHGEARELDVQQKSFIDREGNVVPIGGKGE